jgi:DNA-binding response OmpR family regulator
VQKILVVDDEPAVRSFVGYALRGAKFEVTEATHGDEALAAIRSSVPDLVLLDIRMPGMDGKEVLRHIRKSQGASSLPVMFLTGTILEVDELVEALELDPSDFVTKEVSARELVARVRWVLRREARK